MNQPIASLPQLLRQLEPVRNAGVFVYSSVPTGFVPDGIAAVAPFREDEGLTLIVTEAEAYGAGLPVLFRACWITLRVHSDLQAVGLTAAVARALTDAGISCNVVAAAHHDHVFVPYERGDDALDCLRALQQRAAAER
jgi:hypothetical protein